MRLISFALTQASFLDGRKTVTRRIAWAHLQTGTVLMGVDKAMGFRRGQSPKRLGAIEVTSVRRERLDEITLEDVAAEGVDGVSTVVDFVSGFCAAMRCEPDVIVTRIEFRRVGW